MSLGQSCFLWEWCLGRCNWWSLVQGRLMKFCLNFLHFYLSLLHFLDLIKCFLSTRCSLFHLIFFFNIYTVSIYQIYRYMYFTYLFGGSGTYVTATLIAVAKFLAAAASFGKKISIWYIYNREISVLTVWEDCLLLPSLPEVEAAAAVD